MNQNACRCCWARRRRARRKGADASDGAGCDFRMPDDTATFPVHQVGKAGSAPPAASTTLVAATLEKGERLLLQIAGRLLGRLDPGAGCVRLVIDHDV